MHKCHLSWTELFSRAIKTWFVTSSVEERCPDINGRFVSFYAELFPGGNSYGNTRENLDGVYFRALHEHKTGAAVNNNFFTQREWPKKNGMLYITFDCCRLNRGSVLNVICRARPRPGPVETSEPTCPLSESVLLISSCSSFWSTECFKLMFGLCLF
jgi:hypothetical protein